VTTLANLFTLMISLPTQSLGVTRLIQPDIHHQASCDCSVRSGYTFWSYAFTDWS